MGKVKKTSEAVLLTRRFQRLDGFKVNKDFENIFPLNFIPKDRKARRVEIWQGVRILAGDQAMRTVKHCRAALVFFSQLLVPYSFIPKTKDRNVRQGMIEKIQEIAQHIEQLKRTVEIVYFPQTKKALEREIKWRDQELNQLIEEEARFTEIPHNVEGIFCLHDKFKKACPVSLSDISLDVIESQIIPLMQDRFSNLMEFKRMKGDRTDSRDLPLQALALTIYECLWKASGDRGLSAKVTADLCNEYLVHNQLIKNKFAMDTKKIIALRKNQLEEDRYLRSQPL